MSIVLTNTIAFERDLKKFAEKAKILPGLVAKRLAFEVFAGVTSKTPVDTGYARANWKFREGNIDKSVLDKTQFGAGGGASAAKGYNDAETGKIRSTKAGKTPVYYITNGLPYIHALENGHSKQSGKGYMVARTVNDVKQNISRLLKELEK